MRHVYPVLAGILLHSATYRAILILTAACYWLLYSFSSGIIQYPPSMINPVLFFHNPYFAAGDFYSSGLIWLPVKNLQINLLAGPTLISVLLSILFGLNIVLGSYILRARAANRKLGLAGVVGLAPTLFSSGIACCSAPFGALVLSALVPSASAAVVSLSFNSGYGLVIDAVTAAAMVLSFLYTASRIPNNDYSPRSPHDSPIGGSL